MAACAPSGTARDRKILSGNPRQQRRQRNAQACGRPVIPALEPAAGQADHALPAVELGARCNLLRRHRCCVRAVLTTAMLRVELSLIHISEPTRLGMISYAVF